jgi:hypothetical protein
MIDRPTPMCRVSTDGLVGDTEARKSAFRGGCAQGFVIAASFSRDSHCVCSDHPVKSGLSESRSSPAGVRGVKVALTCPSCGNDRNFLVKTLQMHVVHLEDGRVEVSEESRPAVLEVLCDECETALKFEEFEDTLRQEVLLTIGAR